MSLARQQWRDGTPLALLDPTLVDSYVETQVLRCINVGLLCVEEDAEKRPRMASVVQMLNGNSVVLSTSNLLAVPTHNSSERLHEEMELKRFDTKLPSESINEASFTELYPR
ncbi:hypothetical protein ACH5RR_014901 [Cinchona calisaya]|uniref:S-locus receptor kinase C-terminal domain-containing protein n=1 Tax=Cinchona calisaya TaxID=153742 RepID=A0ABD2ZUB6_9GENT